MHCSLRRGRRIAAFFNEGPDGLRLLLGGSWVVISRVISKVTIIITHNRRLITPLITTPEPPSRA